MATPFVPGTAGESSTEVELSLSCRNLRDMDYFSKSDPMCVVSLTTEEIRTWHEIKRTEVVYNNLNPKFATKVQVTYRFEEQQHLKFDVYDIDSNNTASLEQHDFLGSCTTTLGQIVSNKKLSLPLNNCGGSKNGFIEILAEELSPCKDEITLRFSARNLDRKDFFGWSDPFLEIAKANEERELILVHRTEVIKWTAEPNWKPFTLKLGCLCGGDFDRNLQISCLDWNRSGKHKLIGKCHVTLRKLSEGPSEKNVYLLINPKKSAKSANYVSSGTLILNEYRFNKVHSFLDFILGGTQIHCTVAIDFTASNGDPNVPQSLHYFSSCRPNQYEQALGAVVEIIQDYDASKLFPVLGFGARIPPDGHVSHEFYVNFHPNNPHCEGVTGVVQAYKSCLRQIQLYGPTNFSPVINHVAKFAQAYLDGSHYFVLLIITDGVISDLPQTIDAIIYASTLPMSIIIIGVGGADFSEMEVLDADTVPLKSGAMVATRDIVQFVPFRDFQKLSNVTKAKAYLAKEVLAEIPDQIVGYMRSRGIVPKAPSHVAGEPSTVRQSSSAPPPSYAEAVLTEKY